MMRTIVDTLLVQSAAGGLLIGLMLLLRRLCSERISARLMYALWLAVALRLLIPLELPGLVRFEQGDEPARQAVYFSDAFLMNGDELRDEESSRYENAEESAVSATIQASADSASGKEEASSVKAAAQTGSSRKISLYSAVIGIWLTGVCLTGAYMTATNLHFMRRVRNQAVPADVGCELPVYKADVDSPFLSGIIRKKIYISDAAEQNGRLRYVLAHEMEHARNHDNLWLLVRNIVCALYWFHPLVWLAGALSTRDCEKACDERVVMGLTKGEKVDYAEVLFEMSMGRRTFLPMVNAVGSGKGAMTVRIARILKAGKAKRWVSVLTAVVMLTVSVFSCATGEAVELSYEKTADMAYDTLPHFASGAGRLLQLADGILYEEVNGDWKRIGGYENANAVAVGDAGVFISERGETGDSISLLRADGGREQTWNLPDGIHVVHMAATGEGIALTAEKNSGNINEMEMLAFLKNGGTPYLFEPDSGELKAIGAEYAYDLTTDEEGRLYLLHEDEHSGSAVISRYSADGEPQTIAKLNTYVEQIIAVQGGVYFSDGIAIQYLNLETGEPEYVTRATGFEKSAFLRIAFHKGRLYAVNGDWNDGRDSALVSLDLNPKDADGARKLTIVNYGLLENERAGYMEKWWRENYPEVELAFVDMYETTQFATALMSGDFDFDIICADGKWNGSYAASGAFLPLDGMERLMAAMDESGFLPYEPLMTYDGRLYGVPYILEPEYLKLNTALMEKLNLTWPEAPYSWTEIADWAVEALEGTGYYFTANTKAPFQYVDAKLQREGEVILDTPQFRASAQAHKKLYDAGLIDPDYGSGRSLVSIGAMTNPTETYAPLPTIEGEAANTARVTGFYVSAATKNADLAEAFLTGFVSEECQHTISSEWIYYMVLEDAEGYPDENRFQSVRQFGRAALDLRLSAYDGIVLEGRNQYMQGAVGLHKHWKEYLDGAIDLDEYISIAQARLDMIQYE